MVNLALQDDESSDNQELVSLPTGDPYGAVLWPASLTVASHLLEEDDLVRGKRMLELGAGTGLVSIAAALQGKAQSILATDYEQIPLQLLEYAARNLNQEGSSSVTRSKVPLQTALFDFCDLSLPLPPADLVVAADVIYEPRTGRLLAHRVVEALALGCHVLIADSPGRAGRPAFLNELSKLGLEAGFVDTVGSTVMGSRHELICGADSPTVSKTPRELVVSVLELVPKDYPEAIVAYRKRNSAVGK